MNIYKIKRNAPAIGIAMMLFLPGLNYCLSSLLEYVYNARPVSMYIYMILLLSLYFGVFALVSKRELNKTAVVVSFIVILGTIISYVLYPNIRASLITKDYHIIYSEAIYMALFCVPSLYLSSSNKNWDLIIKISYYIAPFVVVIGIYAYYSTVVIRALSDEVNYMSFAYSILTGGCVCFYAGLKEHKWFLLVFGVAALIAIVVGGSRGSAVCFLLFIFLLFFYRSKEKTKHNYFAFLIAAGFLVYLFLYSGLFDFIGSGDVYFRNISKFESGEFTESSSRDLLKAKVLDGIYDNPVGYGFFGDRYILKKGADVGIYAHNIFLEIICDFGWVLGAAFILYLLVNFYKIIRFSPNNELRTVLLLVLPSGFFALFFSDSFLINPSFYILLGIVFNVKKSRRKASANPYNYSGLSKPNSVEHVTC